MRCLSNYFFGWGGRGELANLNSPSPKIRRKQFKILEVPQNINFYVMTYCLSFGIGEDC
jgi:hypothetical protein